MEKIIRNGKVAIALSPGFGAGWTTWNSELSPFEPKVIEMIEEGRQSEIDEDWCEKELDLKNIYCGGAADLIVEWIEEGSKFSINDYDGNESLYIDNQLTYQA